jgi:transcriptional regulator with XRE-family HTH domain
MSINTEKLGKAIAELRRKRGLTQKTIAEATELTVNYISLVENGERTMSLETLNRFSAALRIPAEFLSFLGSIPSGRELPAVRKLRDDLSQAIYLAVQAEKEAETAS